MSKKGFLFALMCLFTVTVMNVHGTGIPQLINYQGVLLDSEGDPITDDQSIEFLLYDVETEGTPLWSEVQEVTIADGLFNVLLGSVTPIPYQVFDSTEVYLALKVESDDEMEPRKQLVSVGYAFHANRADNLGGSSASDYLQTVNLVPPADGNLDLVEGVNITITPDDAANTVTISAGLTLPEILSSIDGVSNDGGDVDLIEGSNITITPDDAANTITISAAGGTGGDDLGNHSATQNIRLNGYYLSNDGGNEGISISNDGSVRASGRLTTGIPSVACGVGDIASTGNIYADNHIISAEGFIKTGTPNSIGISAGDIVADHDVLADDWVQAMKNIYSVYGYIRAGIPTSAYVAGDIAATNNLVCDEDVNAGGNIEADGYVQANGTSGRIGHIGGTSYGAYGKHMTSNNYGYIGGATYAVYGYNYGATAGRFFGNVEVSGIVSKGAGSFKIDHPLDPANKYLQHSFVESPDMMNIYNGNVILNRNGEAIVELPEYFEALNMDFRYQLTSIGGSGPNLYIAEEMLGNQFKIAGGLPDLKVSWQVTGIRQDAFANANRIKVELEKSVDERGKYLHTDAMGLPESASLDYNRNMKMVESHKSINNGENTEMN
ncbi:hypothetical protein HQ585_12990 [candidate division KSB1 bacterium]|nr:hypothetical protein [candidate division KSB1 bacterium]